MKIFYNANVVTLEDEKDINEAICIEEGKIKAIGTDEEVLKLKDDKTEVIDLEGRTILPGFIDPHSHFGVQSTVALYSPLYPAPIGDVNSIDKIVEVLKEDLISHKDNSKFLMAVGYDHEQLKERRHPTRDDLDRVSKDVPIAIAHSSLHVGTFNSKAIEVLGIEEEAKDPEGGVYGRYEGTNKINGYAEELAFQMHLMHAMKIDSSEVPKIIKEGQLLYAKAGITTVQDGFTGNNEFDLFKFGVGNKLLDLDVHCYPPAMESIRKGNHWIDGEFGIKFGQSIGNNVHFSGFKIVLDGSPQARTAWMSKPYEVTNDNDDPNYVAYPIFEDEAVIEGLLYAINKNAPILVHCNGDAAADQFIRTFKEALKRSQTNYTARAVMIHCQTVREDQIDEMAKLNIIPAMYPIHTYFWGDTHIKNFGRQRANKISNQKYAISKGLLPTSHEDCPVLPPNTLLSVWAACNRVTRTGEILGEDLRLSRFEALRTVTYNAAYQYAQEDLLGTLKEGKLADLVILDTNVLTCSNDELFNANVLETIKRGKTIFKR